MVEIKDWLKYDPRRMPGLKNLTILTCSFLGRGIVVVVGSHFLVFFHTVIKQCFKALRPCSHSHCTYRLPTKQAGRGKKKQHYFTQPMAGIPVITELHKPVCYTLYMGKVALLKYFTY